VEVAEGGADLVLRAPRGRARQMNAGAKRASGDVLVFLHADTRLPAGADERILSAVPSRHGWGRFDIELFPAPWPLPIVATMMNWRSRVSGIATGDQAMFVARGLFDAIGGFPDVPLMEDIRLSRLLKRHGRPLCLRDRATTSSRRWLEGGILRTIGLMWSLRLRHALGADPARLHDRYHGIDG
jgi:rSAM/selenodomain-associated transferase 2